MLPEQQEVLHNRPIQVFFVVIEPLKYTQTKITGTE